jgi:hypothetical protein
MDVITSSKKDVEDYNINESYLDIQLAGRKGKSVHKEAQKFTKIDEVLKKSVITPGFEKLESVPAYQESYRIMQKKRKVCIGKISLSFAFMNDILAHTKLFIFTERTRAYKRKQLVQHASNRID